MTITEFLEARIAEDEAANDMDVDPPEWCDRVAGNHYEHARIAAECAAKRAMVKLSVNWDGYTRNVDMLRILAAVYASHPDYSQEWAVD